MRRRALVDAENVAIELLALFEHFAGMADLAGPRHIGDVQQAVDPFFEFDERTVVGEVANLAFDYARSLDTCRRRRPMGSPASASYPATAAGLALSTPRILTSISSPI